MVIGDVSQLWNCEFVGLFRGWLLGRGRQQKSNAVSSRSVLLPTI